MMASLPSPPPSPSTTTFKKHHRRSDSFALIQAIIKEREKEENQPEEQMFKSKFTGSRMGYHHHSSPHHSSLPPPPPTPTLSTATIKDTTDTSLTTAYNTYYNATTPSPHYTTASHVPAMYNKNNVDALPSILTTAKNNASHLRRQPKDTTTTSRNIAIHHPQQHSVRFATEPPRVYHYNV